MNSSKTNTVDPLPTTSPPDALGRADAWMGLSQAHHAIMLNDRQQLLRQDRLTVAHHRSQYLGQPLPDEDDEMIHIGDNNTHHHQELQPTPKPTSGLGPLASGLVGAALALGTGGIGFGLWQALQPAITKTIDNTRELDIDVRSKYEPE